MNIKHEEKDEDRSWFEQSSLEFGRGQFVSYLVILCLPSYYYVYVQSSPSHHGGQSEHLRIHTARYIQNVKYRQQTNSTSAP